MCGRYAITLPPEAYRSLFGYVEQPNFPPRYNVAPTQPVPIVHADGNDRHFRLVRWGFLPGWVKDTKAFPLVINARGETLIDKPAFRNAFRRRRCIFLADGFYEWQRQGKSKAPFLVRMRDGGPMPLAGIWETYHDSSGGEIDTAAIVTTTANGTLARVHERMPVILGREAFPLWLDNDERQASGALELVRPCPDEWLDLVPISSRVNSVANDDPDVQTPLPVPVAGPVVQKTPAAARARLLDEDAQGRLF
ncbi:SOS response-associated peptidase [Microvirga massiliensis]|uniref:SOS response-associated peptidase n=1 Tax=Microvirga massiliensis TaxID=1033741 RepID=UPI00062BC1A0|nr:SOS response-associated peptidase [Microvirga massiliensis]